MQYFPFRIKRKGMTFLPKRQVLSLFFSLPYVTEEKNNQRCQEELRLGEADQQ